MIKREKIRKKSEMKQRWTHNQTVSGSSPAGSTVHKHFTKASKGSFFNVLVFGVVSTPGFYASKFPIQVKIFSI